MYMTNQLSALSNGCQLLPGATQCRLRKHRTAVGPKFPVHRTPFQLELGTEPNSNTRDLE